MSQSQKRPLRVFLCHSSNDKLVVYELYQRLSAEGWLDVWLDTEKLYPGQDWNLEIEQAVESSDVIIACLSESSVTKEGYVQRELRTVLDLADYKPEGTLFVIPVRLEECEPPRRLKIWQYADYFPKEAQDGAYERLLVSLRMRAARLGILTDSPKKGMAPHHIGMDGRIEKDRPGRALVEKHGSKVITNRVVNRSDKELVPTSTALVKEITGDSVTSQKQNSYSSEKEKISADKGVDRNIRFIGLAIIVLIVIAGIWFFVPKSWQPKTFNHVDFGNTAACERFADIPVSEAKQYSQPPLNIDVTKQYFAAVKMAKGGEFVIQLYPDKAPQTVNSFIFLSCKDYFDGVTFHRVLEGFMAQGGDPTGTGTGGPGYYFEYEENDLKFDKAGVVAMANQGARTPTNGSQFFITFGPTEYLNGGYTIFGQVTEGMDVVNGITRRDPNENPDFQGDVIETIAIAEQ